MSSEHDPMPDLPRQIAETQRAIVGSPAVRNLAQQIAQAQRALQGNPEVRKLAKQIVQTQRAIAGNPALRNLAQQVAQTQRALHGSPEIQRIVSENWRGIAALRGSFAPPTIATQTPAAASPISPSTTLQGRPWREVASFIRRQFFGFVMQVDAKLSDPLDGTWERISRGGPHSVSQAAHSAIEFIDSFLRQTAPEKDVLGWHESEGRVERELHNGRPTRELRMRYLLRHRDPDGNTQSLFIVHGAHLVERLQAIKHGATSSIEESPR